MHFSSKTRILNTRFQNKIKRSKMLIEVENVRVDYFLRGINKGKTDPSRVYPPDYKHTIFNREGVRDENAFSVPEDKKKGSSPNFKLISCLSVISILTRTIS
jgi:hypothetical protein